MLRIVSGKSLPGVRSTHGPSLKDRLRSEPSWREWGKTAQGTGSRGGRAWCRRKSERSHQILILWLGSSSLLWPKCPTKNDLGEENLIWGSLLQRLSPWSADPITLGPSEAAHRVGRAVAALCSWEAEGRGKMPQGREALPGTLQRLTSSSHAHFPCLSLPSSQSLQTRLGWSGHSSHSLITSPGILLHQHRNFEGQLLPQPCRGNGGGGTTSGALESKVVFPLSPGQWEDSGA